MKKLNLKLGGIKEMLTREQMKKVVGGYNPNCAGVEGAYTWYCCGANGSYTTIGTMTCEQASAYCSTLLTNDTSRCV